MKSGPTKKRMTVAEASEQIIECGKLFYERHWMWGSSGNLSVKTGQDPLEFVITPSGVNKGHLTASDLITLGEKVSPKTLRPGQTPSSETLIHETLYRALPGCGAVFHVHSMYATLMSVQYGHATEPRTLHVPWFEMMKGVGVGEEEAADITILPNWSESAKIAKDLTDYVGRGKGKVIPAVLVYNHGLTAWGTSAEQTRNHLEIIEWVCEYLFLKQKSVTAQR